MSFFRTYINDKIQQELFNRVDATRLEDSTLAELTITKNALTNVQTAVLNKFVKSCWSRAAVVLSDGKPVFLNNIPTEEKNSLNPIQVNDDVESDDDKYLFNTFNKYKGRPGITTINTTFKDYLMKQATINYYVPNPNEFDDFKDNFLQFGRYMFLEWGWSIPSNLQLPKITGDELIKISKNIEDRILKGNGNYCALVGVVTNYTFNLTKDGAYEGTIELSSMGRNVLGQYISKSGKIENLATYVSNNKDTDVADKIIKGTYVDFTATMKALKDVVRDYATKYNTDNGKTFIPTDTDLSPLIKDSIENTESYRYWSDTPGIFYAKGNGINYSGDAGGAKWGDWKRWSKNLLDMLGVTDINNEMVLISWGWFEDYILNSYFSFVSGKDDITFKTEFRSTQLKGGKEISNRCKSHPELYTLGLDSVILPGKTRDFDLDKIETEGFGETQKASIITKYLIDKINELPKQFEQDTNFKDKEGNIRNIYFSAEYLMEIFAFTTNIEKSINDFWQKVSDDYGGFWRFSLVEDEDQDGKLMITDLNLGIEDDTNVSEQLSKESDNIYKVFPFSVYSRDSIISDFQITSENSAEMATMAVFGSNTKLTETGVDMGKGYTPLAMRAISMLENKSIRKNTKTGEKQKEKYDSVLNSIVNPIIYNYRNSSKKSYEGTSNTLSNGNDEGQLKRDGGIEFSRTSAVYKNIQTINNDILDNEIDLIIEQATQALNSRYYWSDQKVQFYSGTRKTMFDPFKRTMLYKINKEFGDKSNYQTVLPVVPISLSFSIQGIGGIKIGDLFWVDYLPKKYRTYCHFMVVNVEHEISPTGWNTKIDSRMIVDIPKLIADSQTTEDNRIEPKIVNVTDSLSASLGLASKQAKEIADKANNLTDYTKMSQGRGTLYGDIPIVDQFDIKTKLAADSILPIINAQRKEEARQDATNYFKEKGYYTDAEIQELVKEYMSRKDAYTSITWQYDIQAKQLKISGSPTQEEIEQAITKLDKKLLDAVIKEVQQILLTDEG